MGLVPGAGGTVSITRRIGRQRTALLALTGPRSTPPPRSNGASSTPWSHKRLTSQRSMGPAVTPPALARG